MKLRVVAAALAMLSGCGGPRPEPLPAVPAVAQGPEPRTAHRNAQTNAQPNVRIPRPDIGIGIAEPRPDLSEEPRWPLTVVQHPTLEPQFNVAGALADPGISWTELCARGVQHRHDPARRDELVYLGGWCAAEQHDVRLAVTTLAPLMRSAVPGIANGAALDLVNVLVASEDADHATQLLADIPLRAPHVWDLLAAAYFEVGKNADAVAATSTAVQLDAAATPAATCHRITRMLLLGPEASRPLLLDQLDGMTRDPKHVDETCMFLDASVRCTVKNDCGKYYASQQMWGDAPYVASLYDRWGDATDWSGWISYAWQARHLYPATGTPNLVSAALDAAVVTSGCNSSLAAISKAADALATGSLRAELQPKVQWIHSLADDHAMCTAFRAQWLVQHPQ